MNTQAYFDGVWTALVTPFTSSSSNESQIDLPAFKALLRQQEEAQVKGVIVCGSTGEAHTLTLEERKQLILTTVEELKDSPVQVFAGTGTNNTAESVQIAQWASQAGVDGLLVVTPYYNKPPQAGMEAHFKAIADASSVPIILYNVPGRTGVTLSPETIAKLSNHPRIRALKESTANITALSEIFDVLQNHPPFTVLCGDDLALVPYYALGTRGIVSVASNLIPKVMVSLDRAMRSGNLEEAKKLHRKYYPIFRDLFLDSNPIPVKYAMAQVGLCQPHVRLPLVPLSQHHADKLQATLRRCEVL